MPDSRPRIGVIGCGNISTVYLKNLTQVFRAAEVVACADLVPERAQAQAAAFGVPRACSPDELLADPDVEIVLNLTIPLAHAEVALAAIAAGKSVYSEKPLAATRADGLRVMQAARTHSVRERIVRVSGAPDTFLGAGIQTCRRLIDDGAIGRPVACVANMLCHGHEHWHPDPAFYYKPGGGPMLDMGPYYLTALVSLLGPVRRVAGLSSKGFAERTVTSAPKRGTTIPVDVPTHVIGLLEFAQGCIGTITTSFDVWAAHAPGIEVYGTEGSLAVPNPNNFGGPVILWTKAKREWTEMPLVPGYTENSRGIGVSDMAAAMRSGRPHRASGEMAFHVLDVMESIHDAGLSGDYVTLGSTCVRPEPLTPEELSS